MPFRLVPSLFEGLDVELWKNKIQKILVKSFADMKITYNFVAAFETKA